MQQEPSLWQNLSREDCAEIYNSPLNENYRSVILVTNYTRHEARNNSALAIGVIAGYSLSESDAFLALCPDDYLTTYNQSARRPLSAAYIPEDKATGDSSTINYLSPQDADALALNASASLSWKRQVIGTNPNFYASSWDPLPQIQLCSSFWPDQGNYVSLSGTNYYARPRCDFVYCLAESIPEKLKYCRLAYSPIILFSWAILLSINLFAFSASVTFRILVMAFYKWADAKSFYQCHPEQQPEDLKEPTALAARTFLPIDFLGISAFSGLCIFIYLWVLREIALGKVLDREWFYPGASRYSTLQTAHSYKTRKLIFLGSDKFWIVKVNF